MPEKFQPVARDPGGPVAAPVQRAMPSPWASLSSTAGNFAQAYGNHRENRARQRAREAEDARAQRERDASRYVTESLFKYQAEMRRGVGEGLFAGVSRTAAAAALNSANTDPETGIVDPTAEATPQAIVEGAVDAGVVDSSRAGELQEYAGTQAERLETVNAAQEQGRVSPLSASAMVDNIVQETMATFTDVDPAVIFSALEAAGIKNAGFRELRAGLMNEEARDAQDREQYNEALGRARELVPVEIQNLYTEDQMVAIGLTDMRTERELEAAQERLDLLKTQGQISDAEYDRTKRELEERAGDALEQGIIATLGPIFNQLSQINLGEPGQYPQLEAEATNMVNVLRQQLPMLVESYIARNAANLPLEQRAQMRQYYLETIENVYLKPFEERQSSYKPLLDMMQNRMGINMITAAPLIYQWKQAGIDLDYTQLVMESINADPEMADQLANELAGMRVDPLSMMTNETASAFLMKMMSVATGTSSIADLNLNPQQAARMFQGVRRINTTNMERIVRGEASPAQIDSYRNTQMEVATQALNVSPGARADVLANTVRSLVQGAKSERVLTSLINQDDDEALVAGLGTRAAVAQNLQALMRSPELESTGQGYKVEYNEASGRFEIIQTRRNAGNNGNRADALRRNNPADYRVQGSVRNGPPENMVGMQRALNDGLQFLVRSSEWDEDPPVGSAAELRNFYLYGTPTRDMRRKAEEQTSASNTPVADTIRAIQQVTRDVQNGDFQFQTPTIPGGGGASILPDGSVDMQETALNFAKAGQKAGLSNNVVAGLLANVQHESSFNPSLVGDSGTAFGFFQHRNERVDEFVRVTGVRPERATPEQAVRFFIHELDNPGPAGMTQAQAQQIRNASSPEEAAMLIQRYYERPRNIDPERGRTAQSFYRNLTNGN